MSHTRTITKLLIAASCAALLAGCGNKGVLVLPPKPGAVQNKTPAPADKPADHNSVPPAPSQ